MMGVFSMYTGIIYNDIFSLSMNVFGSSWSSTGYNISTLMGNRYLTLDPATADFVQTPYMVGMDPVWQVGAYTSQLVLCSITWRVVIPVTLFQTAQNKIIFLNSFKMKISIIIGVIHMTFGVSLSVVNHM